MPRKKKLQVIDKLDKKLLSLKSGDHFIIEMYLDGMRFCEIKMGYKHARIKPLFQKTATRMSASKLKNKLADTYWCAAKSEATYKAWEDGKKRKPKNWQRDYR